MNKKKFEGISNNGDFNEALALAVEIARSCFGTDFVEWRLKETRGYNGESVNELAVVIEAKPGDARDGTAAAPKKAGFLK